MWASRTLHDSLHARAKNLEISLTARRSTAEMNGGYIGYIALQISTGCSPGIPEEQFASTKSSPKNYL
jgi:hypothetical protein